MIHGRAKGADRLAVHCERVLQTVWCTHGMERESPHVAARLGCTPGRTRPAGLLGRSHLQAQRRAVSAAASWLGQGGQGEAAVMECSARLTQRMDGRTSIAIAVHHDAALRRQTWFAISTVAAISVAVIHSCAMLCRDGKS